jgi:hypothetical protein
MLKNKTFLYFLLISIILLNISCQGQKIPKIDGISFVAPPKPIQDTCIRTLKNAQADWICLMPFAFSMMGESKVIFNSQRQWWGEKSEGTVECIKMAKALNLKVMLKPHVWLRGGHFVGHFELNNEEKWKEWEHQYEQYILHYAKIADSSNVELFCIGTELDKTAQLRPQFWQQLISKVKQHYKGKLTYASNWDSYPKIPFWQELDYIGIDAYFPLSESKTPSVVEIKKAWKTHLETLEKFSNDTNKPILFTEYGYRSMDFTAKAPWESHRSDEVNHEAQKNAYQGFFEACWHQKWFAGGFLWKWYDSNYTPNHHNSDYTPQNKPVMEIISSWYGKKD